MLGERFAPVPHNELTLKVRGARKNVGAGGEALSYFETLEKDAACDYHNAKPTTREYLRRVCR